MQTKHYHLSHGDKAADKDRAVLNAWVKCEITTPYAIILVRNNNGDDTMFEGTDDDPYGHKAFNDWANSLGYFQ